MELRDFKGIWIPKEVWLDDSLTALDKIILMEIDSLDANNTGCYASNAHLASFCQCSETKVSLSIKKLLEKELVCLENFDGRTRVLKSRLSKSERQTLKKCEADSQKMKDHNIYTNINNNNTNIRKIDENNINSDKRHAYGEYGRVKLTETEYQRLTAEFTQEYIDQVIKNLDEYIESNNNKNKYSNYNLVIRKAIREKWFNIEQKEESETSFNLNEFFERSKNR